MILRTTYVAMRTRPDYVKELLDAQEIHWQLLGSLENRLIEAHNNHCSLVGMLEKLDAQFKGTADGIALGFKDLLDYLKDSRDSAMRNHCQVLDALRNIRTCRRPAKKRKRK